MSSFLDAMDYVSRQRLALSASTLDVVESPSYDAFQMLFSSPSQAVKAGSNGHKGRAVHVETPSNRGRL